MWSWQWQHADGDIIRPKMENNHIKETKEPPGKTEKEHFPRQDGSMMDRDQERRESEERGNQWHCQIPKGPVTFLTLGWQPPTSCVSNLTSCFLPILTIPEPLFPCFWPQHASWTQSYSSLLAEFDFGSLHPTLFYNTCQISKTHQNRSTEKSWALVPKRRVHAHLCTWGDKEGTGGACMVFWEETSLTELINPL